MWFYGLQHVVHWTIFCLKSITTFNMEQSFFQYLVSRTIRCITIKMLFTHSFILTVCSSIFHFNSSSSTLQELITASVKTRIALCKTALRVGVRYSLALDF